MSSIVEKKQYETRCDRCNKWFDCPGPYTRPEGWTSKQWWSDDDSYASGTDYFCPECSALNAKETK